MCAHKQTETETLSTAALSLSEEISVPAAKSGKKDTMNFLQMFACVFVLVCACYKQHSQAERDYGDAAFRTLTPFNPAQPKIKKS